MKKGTAKRRRRGAGAVAVCTLLALAGCGLLGRDRSSMLPDPAEDARIRSEVESRLASEPSIGPGKVRVEVVGSAVSLHGPVDGFGALQCALANAEMVRGVRSVADFLVLRPGPRTVHCLVPRSHRASRETPARAPEA